MAFTEEYVPPQRWWQFRFYQTAGADGVFSEAVSPGIRWRLAEVRLHFSTAFASVEDLVLQISSINGSYFNTKLLSQALNGVQDLFLHYSDPLVFQSDDQLKVSWSMASAVNLWGIEVIGWAVRES